jgi:hypothetical protein
MDENPALPVALKSHRERTIDELIAQFANDGLELPEFERRLDLANRATTLAELDVLTRDPPARPSKTSATVPATSRRTAVETWTRDRQFLVAVMGGAIRRGRWNPAQRTFLFAFWGGAELDFREALLPQGITEISIVAIMGGAEIIVPPGVNVECDGIAIMGGFDHSGQNGGPDSPTLRVNGLAIMGGVDIKCRLPGESGSDAKSREREEKRRLRKENR